MNISPRRPVPWTLLVLAAVAALFFSRMTRHVDPDLFFHLKEGSRVVLEGRLPLAEDYSYTRGGKAMVATEWLSGAAFYLLFRAGGYPAVAAFSTLMIVAALWLTTLAWEQRPPEAAVALLLALTAFAFLNFALAKVQNFTFLLFALSIYWVRLWERGRRWTPWALAGILAVWVNLHGGFTLGWGLLAGICLLDFKKNRRAVDLAPWALGTLACFLHPNGATAFVYPLWFVFAPPAARSMIVEWTPLRLELSASPYALLLMTALAARIDRLREKFPWTILAAVSLVMGLKTRKMIPFFSLTALLAVGLSWARMKTSRSLDRFCLAATLAVLLSISAVVVREARAHAPLGSLSDFEREYPREAAEALAQHPDAKRVFHPYKWGGYLLWKLPPRVKIFVDGRLDPYWTLLADYEWIEHAHPGWEALAEAYGIDSALMPPGSPLASAMAASGSWKAAGDDGRAILFVRK